MFPFLYMKYLHCDTSFVAINKSLSPSWRILTPIFLLIYKPVGYAGTVPAAFTKQVDLQAASDTLSTHKVLSLSRFEMLLYLQ
jgi:hypothetical protein